METNKELFEKIVELQSHNQTGTTSIMLERLRHFIIEGWTPEHDDKHTKGELVDAAVVYLIGETLYPQEQIEKWPWDISWYKPGTRIRDLEKAGALIAAEIDRLKRLENGMV